MVEQDRFEKIIKGLAPPQAYPHRPHSVEEIRTSVSVVFVADELTYKLEKTLFLPYLGYSTLEKRKHYCELELELNRRPAPDIYLYVVQVVEHLGWVRVELPGSAVEFAVKMKRLPGEKMMNVLLENERVTPSMVDDVAVVLADLHERARSGPGVSSYGNPDAL